MPLNLGLSGASPFGQEQHRLDTGPLSEQVPGARAAHESAISKVNRPRGYRGGS